MLARRLLLTAAWIAVALAFAAFLAGHADSCRGASAHEPRREQPPLAYVGGDVCRSCHGHAAGTLAAAMGRSSCPPGSAGEADGASQRAGSLSGSLAGASRIPCDAGCEQCHGPGEAHVNLRRNAPEEIPDRDATIANPGKLIPGPRMHVCLECHLGDAGSAVPPRGPRRHLSGVPPAGHPGASTRAVAAPPAKREGAGPGSQGERLMRSRCFQVSGAAIDCLTCHDPHRSAGAGKHAPGHFRRACLTCHVPGSCTLPVPERLALSPVDDCVACHMPRREASDRRPRGSTDHWIR